MSRVNSSLVILVCAVSATAPIPAQSIYGTITGIVSDPSNAVIADATIKLRDRQSGNLRETVTNSEGYYTFASAPPGGYEITVTAPGFETYDPREILGIGKAERIDWIEITWPKPSSRIQRLQNPKLDRYMTVREL